MDIHHDDQVPNTWWAAENTQPCVHVDHVNHAHEDTGNMKSYEQSANSHYESRRTKYDKSSYRGI